MRALLAADSCPSRCRRFTSCSSWGGTGPSIEGETEAQEGQSRAGVGIARSLAALGGTSAPAAVKPGASDSPL